MKIPASLGTEYYRGLLSLQSQVWYDRITAQLLQGDYSGITTVLLSHPETAAADCFAAYKAVRDDHPEFFYLGFQSEFVQQNNKGTLKYPMLYSADVIGRVQKQMQRRVNQLIRGTANLRMIDRETIVYERIAREISYSNHDDVRDHNIVGPILTSSGVCEGHNALLLLCFRAIGIPCIKVYGKTDRDGWHCWTIAWINEIPVHCDVTWDASQEGIIRFDYLNLSDRQILCDHYEFQEKSMPRCLSDSLSYYHYRDLCVYSFGNLRECIRKAARNGRSTILLHFNYSPISHDFHREVQRAIEMENMCGNFRMLLNPVQKNMAVIRI